MMLKKLLSLSLVILLLPAVNAVSILAQKGQVDSPVEKIKANVAKRGVGKKARVTVKLRDGSKPKGYISQAGEESFTLTDSKSGQSKTLAYVDVLQVKGQGGLSLGAKLAIAAGITVGALALLYGIACGDDPYC
jgi:hypothetical protein